MPDPIDINTELVKLTAVHNPKSDTIVSEIDAAFAFLTPYRDGSCPSVAFPVPMNGNATRVAMKWSTFSVALRP